MHRAKGLWRGLLFGVVLLAVGTGVVQAADPASLFEVALEPTSSARAAGMGGAFVGLADEGAALDYNPAGLAFLSGLDLQGSHLAGPVDGADAEQTTGRLAIRGLGVSASRLAVSGPTSQSEAIKGTAGLALRLAFIGIGAAGHYVVQRDAVLGELGQGWVADAGVLVSLGPLRVGAVQRNVAGEFTEAGTGGPVDLAQYRQTIYGAALRLGFANLAVDYVQPAPFWDEGAAPLVRAGGELKLGPLAIRAGVSRHRPEGLQVFPEMHTLGASLSLGPVRADYAVAEPWSEGDPFWGAHAAERMQSLGLRLAF